jgi:23S rRNA (uracil1939-C5)-methyltransferase
LANAVASARDAAKVQGLPATFDCDDVELALPDLQRRHAASRPVVSINPARRGLEEGVAEGIVGLSPRRIAYISCNPRALARDLAHFRELGYHPDTIEPFDMFPHTAHVESLALFEGP